MVISRALTTIFFLIGFLISPVICQATSDDFMRSAGKIYVVVGVLVIIFLLIIGYLIYLDRKIHKLENQSPNGEI
jgi:CcmD family protein